MADTNMTMAEPELGQMDVILSMDGVQLQVCAGRIWRTRDGAAHMPTIVVNRTRSDQGWHLSATVKTQGGWIMGYEHSFNQRDTDLLAAAREAAEDWREHVEHIDSAKLDELFWGALHAADQTAAKAELAALFNGKAKDVKIVLPES